VSDRLLVVSSDGHVGPHTEVFREYMDPNYRDEFEAYLGHYRSLWRADASRDDGAPLTWSEDFKRRWIASKQVQWGVEGKWDPKRRLEALDEDGVAVDVMFPDGQSGNDVPFGASLGKDFELPPSAEHSPELKFAGAQAYNRWLADFCSVAPERLLGLVLLGTLNGLDVDAAVREIRWAHDNGIRGGIMLPLEYENPIYHMPEVYPIWEVCEELQMPVHSHAAGGTPSYHRHPMGPFIYASESAYMAHRPIFYFVFGGILERFPRLKVIFTEQGTTWTINDVAMMDALATSGQMAMYELGYIKLKPSEYFARQCYLGATAVTAQELALRHQIGVDKLMWGSDYPHIESQWPNTRRLLRESCVGVPEDEVRQIVGGNAVGVYNIDVEALAPTVERIGPLPSEIVTA
jgi:predicted TIM-barrel fold metal-dependent hydrolase